MNFDSGELGKYEFTDEGYLRCYMRVAKTGELEYKNALGERQIQVVDREVLFAKDSINTLKAKPITDDHPPVVLDSANCDSYLRGLTTPYVVIDGDYLGVFATITNQDLIKDIIAGDKVECSCGYATELEPMEDGRYKQLKRKYNHVAIVSKGRAGKDVKVQLDSADVWVEQNEEIVTFETKDSTEQKVEKMKLTLDSKEFDIEDSELFEAVTALQTELQEKSENLESTLESLKTFQTQCETLQNDAVDIPSTVAFWIDMLPKFKALDSEYEPDYSKKPAEVVRDLLGLKYPDKDFSGKSDEYLMGYYESIAEQTPVEADAKVEAEPEAEPEVEDAKEEAEEVEELNSDSLNSALTVIAENRSNQAPSYLDEYVKTLETSWRTH